MIMNYYKFGSGPEPMVILPGLSIRPVLLNAEAVETAYSIFKNEFTVYLFDRREDVIEGYDIYDMANDTAAMMRELGIERAYVYGVSQGGMIAQIIAVKYPELVSKLCICSSASYTDNASGALSSWKQYAGEKDRKALNESFAKTIYSEQFYSLYSDFIAASAEEITEQELERFEIYSSASDRFDIRSELGSVTQPVFIIGSRADKIISAHVMLETAEYLRSDTDIFLYSSYSHAVYDEAPDIKERVISFFRR